MIPRAADPGQGAATAPEDWRYLFSTVMNPPTLDAMALDQLRPYRGHDGESLLGNLIRTYLDQLPGRVAGLRQAQAQGDAKAVFKVAHMLKSTSASLGAYTLQALCQRFEDAGRREDLQGTAGLLEPFEAEAAKVDAALQAELERLRA